MVSELVTRRVSRIDEDADGNQIFIDENGHVVCGLFSLFNVQKTDRACLSVSHLFYFGNRWENSFFRKDSSWVPQGRIVF